MGKCLGCESARASLSAVTPGSVLFLQLCKISLLGLVDKFDFNGSVTRKQTAMEEKDACGNRK